MRTVKPNKPVKIVKYDGSAESIRDIEKLCKMASDDESTHKLSLLGPPNNSMHIESSNLEKGHEAHQASFIYSNKEEFVVYDPSKTWNRKIVVCRDGYLFSEYGFDDDDFTDRDESLRRLGTSKRYAENVMFEMRMTPDSDFDVLGVYEKAEELANFITEQIKMK